MISFSEPGACGVNLVEMGWSIVYCRLIEMLSSLKGGVIIVENYQFCPFSHFSSDVLDYPSFIQVYTLSDAQNGQLNEISSFP